MARAPRLQLRNITKTFPGVTAVDRADFEDVHAEIAALVGENGAGKSTLMKVATGVYPPHSYKGSILVNGVEHHFQSVRQAEQAGLVMIPQDLVMVDELSVAENIFLNRQPGGWGFVDWDELYRATEAALQDFGLDLSPHVAVKTLSRATQQLVSIVTALSKDAELLVLDEPTSSLSPSESDHLFDRLRALKDKGVSSIFISHRIEEVMAVADRIVVMRSGRIVGQGKVSELNEDQIVRLMLGRGVREYYPKEFHTRDETLLQVRNLRVANPANPSRPLVDNISFDVRKGEVFGIFGLVGAGKSEVAAALFGAHGDHSNGEFRLAGQRLQISSPIDAVKQGIGLITEDRRRYGLVEGMDVAANISLANLGKVSRGPFLSINREKEMAQSYVNELDIRPPDPRKIVKKLSGGNQQKVVVAKWLTRDPRVLILDEPTRGIDVGAKIEIFRIMNRLAEEGVGIIFMSSELSEVLNMCDRILVMYQGRAVRQFSRGEAEGESVMRAATGGEANR